MKISNFIVCDDIRMELGGKISLMGIYTDTINFNTFPDKKGQWPKPFDFAIYSQIEFASSDDYKEMVKFFKVELEYNEEKTTVIADGTALPPQKKDFNGIILHGIFKQFPLKGPGKMNFQFTFYDKEKNIVNAILAKENPIKISETVIKP